MGHFMSDQEIEGHAKTQPEGSRRGNILERLNGPAALLTIEDGTKLLSHARADIVRLQSVEKDLRDALALVKAERDHWHGLVPRADRVKFPFEPLK